MLISPKEMELFRKYLLRLGLVSIWKVYLSRDKQTKKVLSNDLKMKLYHLTKLCCYLSLHFP